MKNNNKPISLLNTVVVLLITTFFFTFNNFSLAQEDITDDFSRAEDAEEKRAKWGTEEFNLLLFIITLYL